MAETQTQRATLAKPMFDYELSADVSQAYREVRTTRVPETQTSVFGKEKELTKTNPFLTTRSRRLTTREFQV